MRNCKCPPEEMFIAPFKVLCRGKSGALFVSTVDVPREDKTGRTRSIQAARQFAIEETLRKHSTRNPVPLATGFGADSMCSVIRVEPTPPPSMWQTTNKQYTG